METDGMSMDRETAAAQLAALQVARAQMADRVVPPRWYDPALGVVVFLLLSAVSLRDAGWVYFATLAVAVAGLWALVTAYRRITGVWVSGLRPGRTAPAIRVWFGVYAVVVAAALAAEFLFDVRGAMVVAGVVLGVTITFLGRWWMRLYVAELRGEL
jgi:hypothetical protein